MRKARFIQNYIVHIDAKTGKLTAYQVPTPFSRNRRGQLDDQDRFWFAEYCGNKIAMFDTRKEGFKEWRCRHRTPIPMT